ncbi:uncharacterized protein LOC142743013 [Rhinoderma darwinii]|uniref:uncharacterized protein LOC142743013 n=1 Tax=Rhinoderma darwinii TaxID=43563 RepID=UPI003F660E65
MRCIFSVAGGFKVEARSNLWNKQVPGYSNRARRQDSWEEICVALYPDWVRRSNKEQSEIEKDLQTGSVHAGHEESREEWLISATRVTMPVPRAAAVPPAQQGTPPILGQCSAPDAGGYPCTTGPEAEGQGSYSFHLSAGTCGSGARFGIGGGTKPSLRPPKWAIETLPHLLPARCQLPTQPLCHPHPLSSHTTPISEDPPDNGTPTGS